MPIKPEQEKDSRSIFALHYAIATVRLARPDSAPVVDHSSVLDYDANIALRWARVIPTMMTQVCR
jgi:hypothetical protein